jgi:hypothetical protein
LSNKLQIGIKDSSSDTAATKKAKPQTPVPKAQREKPSEKKKQPSQNLQKQ